MSHAARALSIGVDFILLGTPWPLGLVCKEDVSPAVKCSELRGLLHEACNGNLGARDQMIERAISLSMFPRNNSETILQYNRLATSLPDSSEHVAFLRMKY